MVMRFVRDTDLRDRSGLLRAAQAEFRRVLAVALTSR